MISCHFSFFLACHPLPTPPLNLSLVGGDLIYTISSYLSTSPHLSSSDISISNAHTRTNVLASPIDFDISARTRVRKTLPCQGTHWPPHPLYSLRTTKLPSMQRYTVARGSVQFIQARSALGSRGSDLDVRFHAVEVMREYETLTWVARLSFAGIVPAPSSRVDKVCYE